MTAATTAEPSIETVALPAKEVLDMLDFTYRSSSFPYLTFRVPYTEVLTFLEKLQLAPGLRTQTWIKGGKGGVKNYLRITIDIADGGRH